MAFKYKKVLMVGATSGIGKALASRMIREGVYVVVVGRRLENLDAFVKEHGETKTEAVQFDVSKLGDIPGFAKKVYEKHPDLDMVFLNAGIQRAFFFNKPRDINLDSLDEEFTVNYLAMVHLTTAFLPYVEKVSQSFPAAIAFTGSALALVPSPRTPNYSASKAALHSFILTTRVQLEGAGSKVKLIEVLAPMVQTEMHDEKHQPDLKGAPKMGLPLDQFTEVLWKKLEEDVDEVPIGPIPEPACAPDGFETKRQQMFQRLFGRGQSFAT